MIAYLDILLSSIYYNRSQETDMLLQQQPQAGQTLEFFKLILPFITLFIGFGLGRFGDWIKKREEINNLKSILFWELSLIDEQIYELVIEENEGIEANFFKCRKILSLNTPIYDKYLGQINRLKPDELHFILFAYQSIKRLILAAKDIISVYDKTATQEELEKNEFLAMRLDLLKLRIRATKFSTAKALNWQIKGRKDLEKKLNQLYLTREE